MVAVVTTAPRQDPTIHTCLSSLQRSGWTPTVFAEPNSVPTLWPTIQNTKQLGVWHNWLQACRWALAQNPDYILTSQDDCLYHPDSRSFIEELKWPAHAAFVSLYTPSHYSIRKRPGVNHIVTQSLWGACALVFKPEVLEKIINHRIALGWKGIKSNPTGLTANSDTAIGRICNALGLKMYFVDPSPVQHIARYSSIGNKDNTGKRNASRIAKHDLPLAQQVYINDSKPRFRW